MQGLRRARSIVPRFTIALALLALGALTLGACAPGEQPCTTPGVCPEGEECLANRCMPLGSDPVPSASERLSAKLMNFAVVTERTTATQPVSIAMGSAPIGDVFWYLRFEPVWASGQQIDSAFLQVSTVRESPPAWSEVPIVIYRVSEAWNPGTIAFKNRAELGLPRAAGILPRAPHDRARIDVTELVQFAQENPQAHHGLAIVAESGSGPGIAVSTGLEAGNPPLLELYVRSTAPSNP